MACYCPHIQCYDCDNYGHVAMDYNGFHNGEYIGDLEPIELDSTDQGETHQANSITLKKMMSETVMSDTFDLPRHKLSVPIQNSLKLLLEEHESQFAQNETSIGTTPLRSMTKGTGTANPVS